MSFGQNDPHASGDNTNRWARPTEPATGAEHDANDPASGTETSSSGDVQSEPTNGEAAFGAAQQPWQPEQYGQAPQYTDPQQFDQPHFGQPQYGQSQYGQHQFGQPSEYGATHHGDPQQFGQPQYGTAQYGATQYGQAQYGGAQYGQSSYAGQPYGIGQQPKKSRTGLIIGVIGGGVLVVLLGIIGITWAVGQLIFSNTPVIEASGDFPIRQELSIAANGEASVEFTVTEPGTYDVTVNSLDDEDPRIELTGPGGPWENDDYNGLDSFIEAQLETGTYTLTIEEFGGDPTTVEAIIEQG